MTLPRVNVAGLSYSFSAIALGHSLQVFNGFYDSTALAWLTTSFVCCIVGTVFHRLNDELSIPASVLVSITLCLGILWQTLQSFFSSPGFYVGYAIMPLFRGLIVAQGVAVAIGVLDIRALKGLWFPALLAVSLALGVWMIKASPDPYIDVIQVHKEAIEALVHHQDPYRITFANIYERWDANKFYNPEVMIGNRLAIGYPYPPASLFFAVPGHVLFGDYRYSEVALLVAAAAFIGYSRRGIYAKLAAALLLTTPRVWFVIEQGWSEPVAVCLLALTVFLLARTPVAAAWSAGILAVTKQYLGFTGLAILRLVFIIPKRWHLLLFGVAFAAAAVTLPLALWHPNAFMRNVVWLQTREPFRIDSLSYLAWAARHGFGQGSFVWAVGAGTIAAVLTILLTRNTAAGFAAAVTFTTFAFFAFGSKAFCNYYFFVIGALCAAVASLPQAGEEKILSG